MTAADQSLIHSARTGNLKALVQALYALANINSQDEYGNTALIYAAYGNHKAILEQLIIARADLDIQGQDGKTALMRAAHQGHRIIVARLIAAGADINISDHTGYTALKAALDQALDNSAIIAQLIAAGADIDMHIDLNRASDSTAFMISEYRNAHYKTQPCLTKGTRVNHTKTIPHPAKYDNKVNQLNEQGETLLMRALEHGNRAIASILIEQGADINIKDSNGKTVMDRSMSKFFGKQADIILLLKAGIRVKAQSQEIQHYCKLLLVDALNSAIDNDEFSGIANILYICNEFKDDQELSDQIDQALAAKLQTNNAALKSFIFGDASCRTHIHPSDPHACSRIEHPLSVYDQPTVAPPLIIKSPRSSQSNFQLAKDMHHFELAEIENKIVCGFFK